MCYGDVHPRGRCCLECPHIAFRLVYPPLEAVAVTCVVLSFFCRQRFAWDYSFSARVCVDYNKQCSCRETAPYNNIFGPGSDVYHGIDTHVPDLDCLRGLPSALIAMVPVHQPVECGNYSLSRSYHELFQPIPPLRPEHFAGRNGVRPTNSQGSSLQNVSLAQGGWLLQRRVAATLFCLKKRPVVAASALTTRVPRAAGPASAAVVAWSGARHSGQPAVPAGGARPVWRSRPSDPCRPRRCR
jgi:hypothetical protein